MSQFLLAVYDTPGSREFGTANSRYADEAAMMAAFERVGAFNEELQAEGILVFAGGLTEPGGATVVTAGGRTEGPLPKAEEILGGMWVIEAAGVEEAIAWAEKGSAACGAPIEVRAFQG